MDKIRIENFIKLYEKSFIENWELPALTDYTTKTTLTYGDLATKIAQIHLFLDSIGLRKGDKVAICGKDSPFDRPLSPNFFCNTSRSFNNCSLSKTFNISWIISLISMRFQ